MLVHRIAVTLALLAYAIALIAGLGAVLIQRRQSAGTLLVAVGMSVLLSRLGALILLVGETWRVLRGSTDRTSVAAWAWAVTMLVFSITLRDWLAWTCATAAITRDLLFNRLPLQAANAS